MNRTCMGHTWITSRSLVWYSALYASTTMTPAVWGSTTAHANTSESSLEEEIRFPYCKTDALFIYFFSLRTHHSTRRREANSYISRGGSLDVKIDEVIAVWLHGEIIVAVGFLTVVGDRNCKSEWICTLQIMQRDILLLYTYPSLIYILVLSWRSNSNTCPSMSI